MQTKNLRSSLIADCIVLFAVALISALPYIGGLGFYADDRDYLGILTHYSGSGFISQFQGLAHEEPAKASARQGQIMQSMAADVPSLPFTVCCCWTVSAGILGRDSFSKQMATPQEQFSLSSKMLH
jgi:hypothetical protein